MTLFWKNKPDKRLKNSTAFQLKKKKKTSVHQNKMQEKITQQEKVGQKVKTAFHKSYKWTTKHKKSCLTLFVNREMQIKTTM